MRLTVALALALPLSASPELGAQDHSPADQASYVVRRTREPIRLDGRLTEAIWRQADSIADFRQREPVEGAPATERTVVKLVRDAEHLYIGVRAYDRDVGAVRSSQLRRDADLSSDDHVTILIDSYHDRRGAFVFATNPNGVMWDAQLVGLDDDNRNWNGIWDVATSSDSAAWTAELAIPLRTLRFDPAGDGIGLNVSRFIRRKNEEVLWRSWRRSEGIYNLLNTGNVVGFRDVPHERPAEARPYVLGRLVAPAYDETGSRIGDGSRDAKVGLDAKLGVSPTLTADFTVNTDFAQVEDDEQVINLTRFPTFFPEKRAFFLESTGLFDLGSAERVQLFYSRRIGLDSTGAPVPIVAGARMYGKQGPWAVGLLDVRTGGEEHANDVAVRVARDVFARSTLAAMFVDRMTPGRQAERGGGIDLDFPLVVRGHNIEPHIWAMGTQTAAAPGTPIAWRLSTDYPNDLIDGFVSFYRIDHEFRPTLGFVRRRGIWEATGHLDFTPRPGRFGIRQLELTPLPSWDIITDRATGNLASPVTWETADFEWTLLGGELQTGDEFEINVARELDAPDESFEIFRDVQVAAGRYWWTSGRIRYETSDARPLSVRAEAGSGGFYDGHSSTAELGATFRGGGHVIMGAGYSVTSAHLSTGDFTATQLTGRLEYALNTRIDFLAFGQHENEEGRADFDLRFHWIPRIGDDVYVVWNSGFTTLRTAPWRFPAARSLSHPLNGALVLKAVHRFAR